jgi:hypothetical protein
MSKVMRRSFAPVLIAIFVLAGLSLARADLSCTVLNASSHVLGILCEDDGQRADLKGDLHRQMPRTDLPVNSRASIAACLPVDLTV